MKCRRLGLFTDHLNLYTDELNLHTDSSLYRIRPPMLCKDKDKNRALEQRVIELGGNLEQKLSAGWHS